MAVEKHAYKISRKHQAVDCSLIDRCAITNFISP
jgi:hypothetical protein